MEYRKAIGKIVKYIAIFMILILGFVMRCELFHATLYNSLYASYPSSTCNIKEREFSSFINDLEEDATGLDASSFFVKEDETSRLEHQVTIFSEDEDIKEKLRKSNNIEQGTYNSLLSGSTTIGFASLEDMTYNDIRNSSSFCVIGSEEDNNVFYQRLSEKYEVGHPRIMEGEETDMIVIIWGMIAIFIVLINGSAILRKKKEMLIRTIYGEDTVRNTIKAIIGDFIILELLYIIAKVFVANFITGDYKPELAFWIFQIGCFVAISLNLLYLRLDVRAVFSNANNNKGTITLLYTLKFVAFLIAVFTLASSFSTLQRSMLSNGADKIYTNYQDDVFLTIEDKAVERDNSERSNALKEIWGELYDEYYDNVRPVIAVKISDRPSIILMNGYAQPLLPESLNMESVSKDGITIIYPRNWKDSFEDIHAIMRLYLKDPDSISWNQQEYHSNIRVPYISSNQLSAFSEKMSPLIIYCGENVQLSTEMFENDQDIIYTLTEDSIDSLDHSLNISNQNFKITTSNVGEFYEYQMNFIHRIFRFFSSFCILVIVLEMAITITLCNLEYRMFGMEYALKKVIGYSFLMRNKSYLIRNNSINIILAIALSVVGLLTEIYEPSTGLLSGGLVIIAENIVMILHILKIEKQSAKKILKGGCL